MAIDLNKMLSVVAAQRRYRESGTNHQKYSPAVPGLEWSQNQPWCATFTCWVFLQAGGTANTDFPLTASCLQQVAWGRARGRFHSSPRVGDLVMFGPGGGTHVEIVVGVSGGTITTIGGNTSGGWGGNYWNGDGVYQKSRSASSAYGFVRPYYGASSGDAAREDDMPEFKWYATGGGQTLQPGEWTTLRWDNHGPGSKAGEYYSVVFGDAVYSLTAFLTLEGHDLPEGTEVQMRASVYKEEGGLSVSLPGGILKRGARGSAVTAVQKALKELGYSLPRYGADGDYGSETESAVRAFQRDAGITVDGEYGPNTKKAMEKAAGGKSFRRVTDYQIASVVHKDGSCHATYSLNEKCPDGYRIRLRAVQYGDKPVKVSGGKVTIHQWG